MDINTLLRGVNNANKGSTNLESLAGRKGEAKTQDAGAAMIAKSDEKVTITNTASRLGQLSQQTGSSSEVNAERVARLRAAIADGSYQPNPAAIAARLSRFEQQLNG